MRRRERQQLMLTLFVLVAAGAAAAYFVWFRGPDDEEAPGAVNAIPTDGLDAAGGARSAPGAGPSGRAHPDKAGPIDPAEHPELLRPRAEMSATRAREILSAARRVMAEEKPNDEEVVEARTLLSAAYYSKQLAPPEQDGARKLLTKIAGKTIFSPKAYDGDPYAFYYTLKPGDTLTKVDRALKLRTPWEFTKLINGIRNENLLRPGTRLKVVRGPFHALVNKEEFFLELYLVRYDAPLTFAKRLPIGIGKEDRTPEGSFQVRLGGKDKETDWNPPLGSGFDRKRIPWGDPEYPLGPRGYWIPLRDVDPSGIPNEGYGLHGTNDPDSIGKAESLGCIRLRNDDIELVFFTLYEKWSSVHIE